MLYKRLIAGAIARSAKSVLLIGPRQTGKSTLMRIEVLPWQQVLAELGEEIG